MLSEADLSEQIMHRPEELRAAVEPDGDVGARNDDPGGDEAEGGASAKLSLNTWRLAALTFFTVSGMSELKRAQRFMG